MAGAPLPVREFASVAEMKAHYAALHRKCFEARPARAEAQVVVQVPVIEGVPPVGIVDPNAGMVMHDAWGEFVERTRAAYGVAKFRSSAQREGRAVATAGEVLRAVSAVTGFTQGDLRAPGKSAYVARARHIASWLLVCRAGKSTPEAGRILGGRDHTTVLHGKKRVEAVIAAVGLALDGDLEQVVLALWSVAWPRAKSLPKGSPAC